MKRLSGDELENRLGITFNKVIHLIYLIVVPEAFQAFFSSVVSDLNSWVNRNILISGRLSPVGHKKCLF